MALLHCRMATVGLLLVAACAPTRVQAADGSISVSTRHGYAVCAGVCPNYDVTVWSDGRVLAVRRRFNQADEVEFFRVSRAEAERFERILLPFKPADQRPYVLECNRDVSPEADPLVLKVTEIAIRWSGDDNPTHLVACNKGNAELIEAIRRALWSVDLYLTARRRD